MEGDQLSETKKLSKEAFFIAMNLHLHGTWLCERLNNWSFRVDEQGYLLPDVVGAVCLILRSAPGTEHSSAREMPAIRKMLHFLDPYLEPRYRPDSSELVPLIYVPMY
jgi:hypothetical protein